MRSGITRTWLWHVNCPDGRLHSVDADDLAILQDEGWVDSPALLPPVAAASPLKGVVDGMMAGAAAFAPPAGNQPNPAPVFTVADVTDEMRREIIAQAVIDGYVVFTGRAMSPPDPAEPPTPPIVPPAPPAEDALAQDLIEDFKKGRRLNRAQLDIIADSLGIEIDATRDTNKTIAETIEAVLTAPALTPQQ